MKKIWATTVWLWLVLSAPDVWCIRKPVCEATFTEAFTFGEAKAKIPRQQAELELANAVTED